MIGLLSCYLYF